MLGIGLDAVKAQMCHRHGGGGESKNRGGETGPLRTSPLDVVTVPLCQPLFICTLPLLTPSLPPQPDSHPQPHPARQGGRQRKRCTPSVAQNP